MIPGTGVLVVQFGHISYKVKIHHFFKNLLIYSQAQIRQTVGIYSIDVKGSVHQNWEFHDPQYCISFSIFTLIYIFLHNSHIETHIDIDIDMIL